MFSAVGSIAGENAGRHRVAVAMATHEPDPALLKAQIESIREQEGVEWRCFISDDASGPEAVEAISGLIEGDSRFVLSRSPSRLGFYRNFERAIGMVPRDFPLIALSDQDDRWYPDKLERLVPLLDRVTLASGQARVVSWPNETVVDRTRRRVTAPEALLFENQVTGSLSVFRRSLLDVALPFPRLHTVTQLHDHWLALCAVSVDAFVVLDELVQDYVQHGANIVGEVAAHRQWTPIRIARSAI